jgi:hypothetical protein
MQFSVAVRGDALPQLLPPPSLTGTRWCTTSSPLGCPQRWEIPRVTQRVPFDLAPARVCPGPCGGRAMCWQMIRAIAPVQHARVAALAVRSAEAETDGNVSSGVSAPSSSAASNVSLPPPQAAPRAAGRSGGAARYGVGSGLREGRLRQHPQPLGRPGPTSRCSERPWACHLASGVLVRRECGPLTGSAQRLRDLRDGRPAVVTDDDVHASAIADGSEREPIVSRHARSSSRASVCGSARG